MNNEHYYQPRSTFVSVIAWIFIILAGLSTVTALLQSFMMNIVFGMDGFRESMQQQSFDSSTPPILLFITNNFLKLIYAYLAVSIILLISSIGLLLRKNWGRIMFLAYMYLSIAGCISGVVFYEYMFSFMQGLEDQPPQEFRFIIMLIKGTTYLFILGFIIMYGWIIKKLSSEDIKAEFIEDQYS